MIHQPSDLIMMDLWKVLTLLKIAQSFSHHSSPGIAEVRKYCTRLGRGGYGYEGTRYIRPGSIKPYYG